MKSYKLYVLLAGLALTWASCSKGGGENSPNVPDPPIVKPDEPKEPTYPTYDAPRWSVSSYRTYECSMTAILTLPDTLAEYQQQNDELALFINDECRGVAERIEVSSGNYVWMAMIMGNTSENKTQKLYIRYWSCTNKHMYEADTNPMFESDTRLGEVDAPYKLWLKIREK